MPLFVCGDCNETSELDAVCQDCECEVCGSRGTLLAQDVYARLHESAFGDGSEEHPGARLHKEVQQVVYAKSLKQAMKDLPRSQCDACSNRAERAAERYYEALMGGSGPVTIKEQCERAYAQKRGR